VDGVICGVGDFAEQASNLWCTRLWRKLFPHLLIPVITLISPFSFLSIILLRYSSRLIVFCIAVLRTFETCGYFTRTFKCVIPPLLQNIKCSFQTWVHFHLSSHQSRMNAWKAPRPSMICTKSTTLILSSACLVCAGNAV